jgi:hypothetical protein
MTPSTADDRITKAARLMLLLELQERGQLDGLTLQEIANLFPAPPNRSTIYRDMLMLPGLRVIRDEMRTHAKDSRRKNKIASRSPRTRGNG